MMETARVKFLSSSMSCSANPRAHGVMRLNGLQLPERIVTGGFEVGNA